MRPSHIDVANTFGIFYFLFFIVLSHANREWRDTFYCAEERENFDNENTEHKRDAQRDLLAIASCCIAQIALSSVVVWVAAQFQ